MTADVEAQLSMPEKAGRSLPTKSPLTRTFIQARLESKMLLRQRTTMLTLVGVPVALIGLAVITDPEGEAGWGATASVWGVLVMAFSLLFAVPAVLSGRRESQLLKRLRTSELGPAQLMGSILLPFYVIGVAQAVAVTTALLAVGGVQPQRPAILAIVFLLAPVVAIALGVALGALAPDADRAQWTVFPILIAAAGGSSYLLNPGIPDQWRQLMLILPLAAFVNIAAQAMTLPDELLAPMPPVLEALPPLAVEIAISVIWAGIAVAVARRKWRWQPRG